MGKYLVPMLVEEKSYQVFVTSRSERESDDINLIYLRGNAKDAAWIETILSSFNFDVVFDFMMYKGDEFESRYQTLLDRSQHYFFFSSSRALAETPLMDETCPLKTEALDDHPEYAIDRYGIRKATEECLLRRSGRKNYTIIRPSMTFSSNRFQFFAGDNFDVIRAAKGLPTLLPKSALNRPTNLTYGKNVAKMLKRLIGRESAMGEAFHAVTKSMTWAEVAQAYTEVFGMTVQVVPDTTYFSLLGLEDGRILDRLRNRNIDNTKIKAATNLNDSDFGSVTDNLREAWKSSNQQAYASSRTSPAAHAVFDAVVDRSAGSKLKAYSDGADYKASRKAYDQRVFMNGFWIRPNLKYWEISEGNGKISIRRTASIVSDNSWINFRILNFLEGFQSDFSYKLSLSIHSGEAIEMNPFLHFLGTNIFRLGKLSLQPGANLKTLTFKPPFRIYSDIAITGNDVKPLVSFDIDDIQLKLERDEGQPVHRSGNE